MATYKKRGYKKAVDKSEEGQGGPSTTRDVFSALDEGAGKTEAWVMNNQKILLGVIGVVVVVVLGFLGYEQFVVKPKEAEASNELFFAQQYFDQAVNGTQNDSLYVLALNGADGKYGLLDIIENYSGTEAANLAQYTAGMAYLNTQKYDQAIAHLQEFSSDDEILGSLALGGIGDAFVQLGQQADGLDYYEKAIKNSNNNFTTPKFLFKAGVVLLQDGKASEAAKYFNRIKNEFPNSEEGRTIDIYIGRAETAQQ
ncbi:tetratricopeptide repeat protein [Galbibacter sp.]|uniref:tetratricopeptide repeat protein n=1 Tax=Galbibacter sp. TaxID=2918471 RepID=UPI002BAE0B9A|nr:tetratricopeptide repeat protein [Galbibacter sp.]HLV62015.1 tetratricopeptide repeat protein [Galbibacter sp.]